MGKVYCFFYERLFGWEIGSNQRETLIDRVIDDRFVYCYKTKYKAYLVKVN